MQCKDFDTWNKLKKNIEDAATEITYNEREIWWCSLGLNIGHEQDGKNELFERPVLILRKFQNSTCLCVPLTSSPKQISIFYQPIYSFHKETFVVVSQIKLISTKRLLRKLGSLGRKDFKIIKNSIHDIIN